MSRSFMLNPFVRIDEDGTITVIVNKSEMGQGVYTSLPMLVAEELECDFGALQAEAAPVDAVYNHTAFGMQLTGGSTSTWSEWERMLEQGARARQKLIAAAAAVWKVEEASCRAERGRVIHESGKVMTYGELAEKASAQAERESVRLKEPSAYRLVGTRVRRLDTPDKVNGKALFGIDKAIPGMLTCVIARCPVFGGKLRSFNADKAKEIPGVREVKEVPTGVVVAADTFWSANLGRRKLECEWDEGPYGSLSTEGLREKYEELSRKPGAIARKTGDPEKALAGDAKRITAEYALPYLAHASMEPLNCVVDLKTDECDIWTGTQFQGGDRNAAALVAGLDPERVRIHTPLLGGGFGRRANPQSDFTAEAVEAAKAIKRPIKVVWTREDDTKGGYYRPMAHHLLSCGPRRIGITHCVATDHRLPVHPERDTFRSSHGAGRHRRNFGGRSEGPCLCDTESPRRPAYGRGGPSRSLVALGRPFPERLRGGELHRRDRP